MTDKKDDNEDYGIDADDLNALGGVVEGDAAHDAESDISGDPDKSDAVSGDYLKEIGDASKSDVDEKSEPKKKSKTGLILGVTGLVAASVVAGSAYLFLPSGFLDGYAGNNESFSTPVQVDGDRDVSFSFDGGNEDFSTNDGAEGGFAGLNVDEPAFSDEPHIEFDMSGEGLIADGIDFDVEPQSVPVVESDAAPAMHSESEPDLYADAVYGDDEGDIVITPQVNDEDRMYDNILAEASTINAPHEAIKIDRNYVNMELQVKRINRVEVDIAQTRKSLTHLNTVIDEIRQQTTSISKALESSAENTQKFREEVKELTDKIDGQAELQKADIKALKEDMKNMASKSIAQNSSAQSVKAAVVEKKPVATAEAPKAENKPAPQKVASLPKPKPVAVRPPVSKPKEDRMSCAMTKVSENWRLKGVTPSSAYVERVQDGEGFLLRKGVALPGFGTVKSFNPVERWVCTTSGIVRR